MKLGYELLVVCTGGACGALFRHFITTSSIWLIESEFPWGTFFSNLVGCFLIGLLIGSGHDHKNETVRLGFGIGFLGSLTTFSAFGADTIEHALNGSWAIASVNVVVNLTVCLVAVVLGIAVAKRFWA